MESKLRNPIIFLPLFLLYCAVTLGFSSDKLVADEDRYLGYSKNLSKGYYSPKDKVSLPNGPGYPILLLPFVSLNIPLIFAKLLNSILLFLSVVYCFYVFGLYSENKNSIIIYSYLMGLYPPFFRWLPHLMSEPFTYFLICGFIYHFCFLNKRKYSSLSNFLICVLFLGILALTKIVFGYVILSGVCIFIISYFLTKNKFILQSSVIFIFAIIFCIPYLIYTYSLTGKVFYWGTSGAEKLYWMSTPYANEYGDWFTYEEATVDRTNKSNRKLTRNLTDLTENHADFYEQVALHSGIEKNRLLKEKAIENIKAHPVKYFKNWIASVGRYLFNFPYSYTPQKLSTYFYLLPNMFLTVICMLCVYPTYIYWKRMPIEIKILLITSLIYSGGSSLINATARQFTAIVPILVLWIFFTFNNLVKIKIKKF